MDELLGVSGLGMFEWDVSGMVVFVREVDISDKRTDALRSVLEVLRDKGVIMGWWDEIFFVMMGYGVLLLLCVECVVVLFLGVRAYGVYVNGFVTLSDGIKELWVGKWVKNK